MKPRASSYATNELRKQRSMKGKGGDLTIYVHTVVVRSRVDQGALRGQTVRCR